MQYYRSWRFAQQLIDAPPADGAGRHRLRRGLRYLVSLAVGLVGGYTVSKAWAETP